MFHNHDLAKGLGIVLICISYFLFFASYFLMIWRAHKEKSHAAPLLPITMQVGIGSICIVGPFIEPALFYSKENVWTIVIWAAHTLCWLVMFAQWLRHAPSHPSRFPEWRKYLVPLAFGGLVVWTITEWLFITFSRDYYVNETYPIWTVLFGIGWLTSLALRPQLRGLSLLAAWGLTLATLLLYVATILGGMEVSYPCHSEECLGPVEYDASLSATCDLCVEPSGYAFVYWMNAFGVLLLLAYAIRLTQRREELGEGWDVKHTLRRFGMHPPESS